jgi:NAD+ dependent glucose-6-phosphate dehydrogenase
MTALITGAAGNLGGKLRRHLHGRHPLRLLDLHAKGDPAIVECNLSKWDEAWVEQFRGIETVVHLAADPTAQQTWPLLLGPNLDALINTFQAAVKAGVKRVVYASSNHVMGGYKDDPQMPLLTTELPPRPGCKYVVNGEPRDSTPYGSAKLFGERLGQCLAASTGLSVIALRIGWVMAGENRPHDLPSEREAWFRLMWLSNRDYCQLMEKAILAPPSLRFAIVNGMSANAGMPWDIEQTKRLLGYNPQDDVTKPKGCL